MAVKRKIFKTVLFILGLLAGGGLFFFLLWRTGISNVIDSLLAFGILPLLLYFGISILNFSLYSLRWKIILDAMLPKGERVSYGKMFMNRMSGFAAGYLTPGAQVAGEPIRVAMLLADGVSGKVATGSVVLDLAFEVTTFVIYVALGLGFALTHGLANSSGVTGSIIFISALLIILIGFFVMTIRGGGFFHKLMRVSQLSRIKTINNLEHWLIETEALMSEFFVGRLKVVATVVGLSFIMAMFKAVEAIYIAHFLGVNVKLSDAFLMSTLPGVSLLLPVPAGLGVYEGSNEAMFSVLGLPINAVAYTVIIRMRDFVFIGIGVTYAIIHSERLVTRRYGK
ncbi:MAG: lysylphosphatidylglycerol synthase transmembrane domain-containing protein [Patescibacteria group bacterium]|jgi:uncharacterized membrane protein YbhN (UPF0104 family)